MLKHLLRPFLAEAPVASSLRRHKALDVCWHRPSALPALTSVSCDSLRTVEPDAKSNHKSTEQAAGKHPLYSSASTSHGSVSGLAPRPSGSKPRSPAA